MKRKLRLLAVAGAVLLTIAPGLADDCCCAVAMEGSLISLLNPMRSPGLDCLTDNLTDDSGKNLTVNNNHVTIDFLSFNLTGPGNRKPVSSSDRQTLIQLLV